ncbi:MAG: hypothetical protein WBD17_01640, partial [Candidatus Omnitrophota bacterium]
SLIIPMICSSENRFPLMTIPPCLVFYHAVTPITSGTVFGGKVIRRPKIFTERVSKKRVREYRNYCFI